jgi:hypothetical protein
MSAPESKQDVVSQEAENRRSWLDGTVTENSAAAKFVELGRTLATSNPGLPGLCSRCLGYRDVQTSTSSFPHLFCSETCEQVFVRIALRSVTLDDCLRIHRRMESLLGPAERATA